MTTKSHQWMQCDCCAGWRLGLTRVWFNGLETWACDRCKGEEEDEPEAAEAAADYVYRGGSR